MPNRPNNDLLELQEELQAMQEELRARMLEMREGKFSLRAYVRSHPYMLLFLYLPVYLIWFMVQEYLISSVDGCFVSYLPLDDKIPFLPGFIYPYITWYPLLLLPALAFLLKEDGPAFTRYAFYIGIGFSASLLICAIFPNCQLLRPDLDKEQIDNFSRFLVAGIYAADTPTNVLPSMHVVGCMGVIFAAFDGEDLRFLRWPLVFWGVLVSISTVFVKQHSVLDVLAGVVLGVLLWLLIYVLLRPATERIGRVRRKESYEKADADRS